MAGLKVVCLISGGKDSLFSILHCMKNGHQPVALANLHPQCHGDEKAVEDLDSYMYQTVGHAVIPLYEKALGLPLYRQEISGAATDSNKSYTPGAGSPDDETEALVPLLLRVKESHPHVNAVSTGAILSDYQRTRVESVAIRLGLIPLSYLWQYPFLSQHSQKSLLEHMGAVGQDSRIIKVASGGLDESFLWQNVADPQTISRLEKAARRFGYEDDGAVVGEGGEYETLAVAGPSPLWKGRITVNEDDRTAVAGDAGSSSLHISNASFDSSGINFQTTAIVQSPPVLESKFEVMLADTGNLRQKAHQDEAMHAPRLDLDGIQDTTGTEANLVDHSLLSNVVGEGHTPSDQIQSIMDTIQNSLRQSGCTLADVTYTTIILRRMSDFADINAVYGFYFVRPNPPARVTIAAGSVLPRDKHIMVSVTYLDHSSADTRKGLHVQSRSYWAPANIGPYSQAISVPVEVDGDSSVVYIAGQIPLIPASMELATTSTGIGAEEFLYETALSLQHVVRIGRVMQVCQWVCAIAFIVANSAEVAESRSKVVHHAWDALLQHVCDLAPEEEGSDAESFDIWNFKHGAAQHWRNDKLIRADSDLASRSQQIRMPRLFVIRVDALPRGARIEWVPYGATSLGSSLPRIPHFHHLLRVFQEDICEG